MDASAAAGAECDVRDLRVLILTPRGRDAALAKQTLFRSGLLPHVCVDLEALRREIEIGAGAALIAEEALAGIDAGKPDALFGSEQPWSSLPMVVLLGQSAPPDNMRRCTGSNADRTSVSWNGRSPNAH